MKKAKRILAVLLAMAMLCGFTMIGVSAAEEAPLTEAQLTELTSYMRIVMPFAVLETALLRVPGWLNWAVFTDGSSFAALQAEILAELKKAGVDFDEYMEWLLAGEIGEHGQTTLAYNKVYAEKGPDIFKKHCAFYIDWLIEAMLFFTGATGIVPLFA